MRFQRRIREGDRGRGGAGLGDHLGVHRDQFGAVVFGDVGGDVDPVGVEVAGIPQRDAWSAASWRRAWSTPRR